MRSGPDRIDMEPTPTGIVRVWTSFGSNCFQESVSERKYPRPWPGVFAERTQASESRRRLAFERLDLLEDRDLLLIEFVLGRVERVLGGDLLDQDLLPTATENLIAVRDEDARGILR